MTSNFTVAELFTVREMAEQYELFAQLSPGVTKEDYNSMLKDMLANGYRMIAVFDNKKCVGISGFWINTKFYCGKYLEPDNVVIDSDYRSKGLGKLLMDWLDAEAKRNSCKTIILDAYVENRAGHKFYFREGFIIRGFHFLKTI